jgi:hypothetical protein
MLLICYMVMILQVFVSLLFEVLGNMLINCTKFVVNAKLM